MFLSLLFEWMFPLWTIKIEVFLSLLFEWASYILLLKHASIRYLYYFKYFLDAPDVKENKTILIIKITGINYIVTPKYKLVHVIQQEEFEMFGLKLFLFKVSYQLLIHSSIQHSYFYVTNYIKKKIEI